MTAEELLPLIRTKYTKDTFTDAQAISAIEEVTQAIKTYCLIPEIPDQLKFVLCNMVIDLLVYEQERNKPEADVEVDLSNVSSVKVGDTSVQLGGTGARSERSTTLRGHFAHLDDIVLNYRHQLNMFRRTW